MPEPLPTRSVRTFDTDGAAAYLGVHPNSINKWAGAGKLHGFRDRLSPGGPWRFNQADLDSFRAMMQSPLGDGTQITPIT